MKKIAILIAIIVLTGTASAKFFTIDPEKGSQPAEIVESARNTSSSSSVNPSQFVSIRGDSMMGELDMKGSGLTGLPTPQSSDDAATKGYVDSLVSSGSDESGNPSSPPSQSSGNASTLLEVLEAGNIAGMPIAFMSGIEIGSDASATDSGVAIGVNASATGDNAVAIGSGANATENDTLRLGSDDSRMNLEVTGDLSVDGEIPQTRTSKQVWSYSFAVDTNGTQVVVPDAVNESYAVSVTPVDSMAGVGIFNKTEENFLVRSSEFTQVDVQVTSRGDRILN